MLKGHAMSRTRRLIAKFLLVAGFVLVARSALAENVRVWRGQITLPTYQWIDSPYPQFDALGGRIVYPYTMQDDILKKPTDRTYKAVFLENEYLRVTCLPELGGRIHRVLDKTRNTDMFHRNEEIKPALIAMRGAWISGGIEWNTGPQGHTVTVVSPVDVTTIEHEDGSATLIVGNTEKIFRTRWAVRLTLHPGKAYLDESVRIFNPTDGVHPYYFWNCTAFPNRPGTRFMFPMSLGTDHAGQNFFHWPKHAGKDLTYLKNYQTMTSIFAYDCVFNFFGAYDVDADHGVVAYANHHELKGKKAWTWGRDQFGIVSQEALSDAGPTGAPYIEVQSGPLLTQAEYGMLPPRNQAAWREWWYPVHGLGEGFEYATRDVAIQTNRSNPSQLELRLIATQPFPRSRVILKRNDKTLLESTVDLSPQSASVVRWNGNNTDPVQVRVINRRGRTLAAYTTPPVIPKVDPPDLVAHPARPDGQPTVDELYLQGHKLDSQTQPLEARKKYEQALKQDPLHGPSLKALAVLDLEAGLYGRAVERLTKALRRDVDDGMAWYYLGAARLHQGAFDEAARCGYKAAQTLDAVALGYNLVGRAQLARGRFDDTLAAFEQALTHNPLDTQARDHRLIALYASGHVDEAVADAKPIIQDLDPTAMIPRAVVALSGNAALQGFVRDVTRIVGERDFTMIEVSRAFSRFGLYEPALRLLMATCIEPPAKPSDNPLVFYELAWLADRVGWSTATEGHLRAAAALEGEGVFPSRPETLDVLTWVIEHNPSDARARLHLGNLLAGLRRVDEAVHWWRQAAKMDSSLSVALRNLGLVAWKKQHNLETAEEDYQRAIAAATDDQDLYYDAARIMTERGRRPEAIRKVESLPKGIHWRADLLLWLAQAYVDEGRYDDAIHLLAAARFSNWEGATGPHDIFARAHLRRGKQDFAHKAYDAALAHFSKALTWPANLEVGRPYDAEEAEARYWQGRALHVLGRLDEAKHAWHAGAMGVEGSDTQNEHRELCRAALELVAEP